MDFASMYQDTAGLQVCVFSNILLYVSQACVHTSVNGELKQKNLGKEYPITYSLSNVVSLWCHNTLVHNIRKHFFASIFFFPNVLATSQIKANVKNTVPRHAPMQLRYLTEAYLWTESRER